MNISYINDTMDVDNLADHQQMWYKFIHLHPTFPTHKHITTNMCVLQLILWLLYDYLCCHTSYNGYATWAVWRVIPAATLLLVQLLL